MILKTFKHNSTILNCKTSGFMTLTNYNIFISIQNDFFCMHNSTLLQTIPKLFFLSCILLPSRFLINKALKELLL
jgi:hypothetical protein